MSKSISIKGKIVCFTETHCLIREIESDYSSFNRSHVWIDLNPVKTLEIGSVVELTGNLYYYGKNQTGLNKIRKVKVLSVD